MIKLKVSDIKVSGRTRVEMGALGELADSIKRLGLLQPIVVDNENNLRCGGRRLEAVKLLGWDEVPVIYLHHLTPTEQLAVELDENSKRLDLSWQEQLNLTSRLIMAWQELEPNRTLEQIADNVGIAYSTLKADMFLNRATKQHPSLLDDKNKADATRKAKLLSEIAARKLLVAANGTMQGPAMLAAGSGLGEPSPEILAQQAQEGRSAGEQAGEPTQMYKGFQRATVSLYHADCLDVMKDLPSQSIDLIITDPPYGVDYDKQVEAMSVWGGESFRDATQYVFQELLPPVLEECKRLLKPGAHFYFFYPMIHHTRFANLLSAAELQMQYVPLLWIKGPTGGLYRHYAMDYEPIFFGHSGPTERRKLQSPDSCTHEVPRVLPGEKVHPCEKPLELISHFIEQSTVPGEVVLEPFMGSGVVMEACLRLNRQGIGIEKEERWYEVAKE